jgi:F-type H+-transporting ATPase subunit b
MVTQVQAQEAETPTEENLDHAVDATHGEEVTDPTANTHAEIEAHGGSEHEGVFPPFDPSTFPSQLLWLAITFGALYLLMSRIALPRIGGILENRKALIDADLAAADASRQKTDAAIAAYETALAEAKSKAQGIAAQSRAEMQADLAARRSAVEADLATRVSEAEARIAGTKAEALTHVDEIATETAQTVVTQLIGDVSPETIRAAVARAKE